MGVLARRFLNLIVPGRSPGVKSLRRIDLARNPLFYRDTSENPAAAGASMMATMETIRFAGPSFTFRAMNNEHQMDCFPLADYSECKLVCADQQSGRGFVFDLDSSMVGTIPTLIRKPWLMHQPISVFVHKPHVDGNIRDGRNGSGLFVMDKFPQPEARRGGRGSVQESEQFVGFINRAVAGGKSWHCHLLPPPPFVRGTCRWYNNCPIVHQITAYGVVGGGSHVCISVDGAGRGTYCLDTESLTWSKAGEWTLPFCGKVEYVPALGLWFGLSADAGRHLAAAGLSGMLLGSSSSQPPQQRPVAGPWKELVDLPEEWKECRDPQFVSLGSSRFCIARFFSQEVEACSGGGEVVHKKFTVLTGVDGGQ